MHKLLPHCVWILALVSSSGARTAPPPSDPPDLLCIDGSRGDDQSPGTKDKPLRSISAAIARLPDPLERSVTIAIAPGSYATTGGKGMSERSLQLVRRMRPGVAVTIQPAKPDAGPVILAWNGGEPSIDAREGTWRIEGLEIGSGEKGQKRGVLASGSVEVILDGVSFQLRSSSDAGIFARRGGRIALRGAIRLNDPLPSDVKDDESFCGIIATDQGVVEFDERQGSSLVLGNGSLAASYYGTIRLGCETAKITSRTRSNCLSIGNSGRIDLRNTETTLVATDPKNTPIGLEHDGHVLAEDAHIKILGANEAAVALQKASTLTCNELELTGKFERALWASSGSMFVGSFVGEVGRLEASTGASIHVERSNGKVIGPVEAKSGGVVSLPDRVVSSK